VDVIAEWLSAARISGTVFSRSELSEPWGLEYPAAPRIAFHVISRGRAFLRLPRKKRTLPLAQGDIVLLGSGQGHELLSSPNGESESLLEYLARHPLSRDRTIRFGGGGSQTVMICGAYSLDAANAGTLLSLLPTVVHLPGELTASSPVQPTLSLLLHEMTAAEQAGDAVLSRLVDVLLIYVLRAWGQSRPEGMQGWLTALRHPDLGCALARIHEEPARDWTVAALAEAAGTSRSAFARKFTTQVGEAPLAYVTRWRMTLAARLLTDTEISIASIASRVGYTSEFAFNRAFSRARGIAPGRWRAQAKVA